MASLGPSAPGFVDEALPATGTTSIAASARVIMPRFPLPQRAFERDSPRRPQSAFARTPLRILRSCRIYKLLPPREFPPRAAVDCRIRARQNVEAQTWGNLPRLREPERDPSCE